MTLTSDAGRGPRASLLRFGSVVVAVGLATLVRLGLNVVWGASFPYLVFFPAVAFGAWYGGPGPGLLALGLSTLSVAFFVLPPLHSFRIGDPTGVTGMIGFLLVGGLVTLLGSAQRAERRRAREAGARLAAIVDSSSDAIIGKTLEGIITSWNVGAERMYGYRAAEVLGRSVALLVPPEGPQDQPGILARIRDGERIPPYETVRQRRDGTRLVVSLSVSPIRDGEGAIVGASAIARDVTDLKRAEEELRAAHQQTVEILESIGDAFYAVDDAWRFTYVNRRAEELWRIDRDALLGKNLWEEFNQSAGTHLHEEMLRAMAERRPAAFEMFSPVLSRWIEVNLYPAVVGLSVYVRDVTDQKEAREEKARLLEEVANSAARQRAFLRDVLASVTEGRLRLVESPEELPPRLEPVGEPIALEKVSLRDLRARASEAVRALGLDKDRGHDLLTAVGEAGMNAVVHAKDAVATVGADPVLGVIQVWVEDRGGGIDLSRLPRATLERGYSGGETPGFGHGFWLMLHTAERVWLLTGPSGTSVVLEMERTPPPPPAWLGGT